MISIFRTFSFVAISACTFTTPFMARAQDSTLANSYGQGVNAYFAGRSCQAESLLSIAIEFNSQDPRPYYFRALSLLRQGRLAEARGDMLVGAMAEAQLPHRFAIGSALERVQGADRLMLEEFRRNARRDVTAQGHLPANAAANSQKFVERDSAVLREQRVVPLDELLRPGGPQSIRVEAANAPQNAATQADIPAEKPATGPGAESPDPFADDAEKPATDAAPAAKTPPQETPEPVPPANPPQETPEPVPPANPPADDENPFGG